MIRVEFSCGHLTFAAGDRIETYAKGAVVPCTRCADARGLAPFVTVIDSPIEVHPEQGRYWPED